MIETQTELWHIQEVAEKVGLTARAIRYYEQLGLLTPAARSEGDYRLFNQADIDRLRTIKALRDDAGFSLADIGELLRDEADRAVRRSALYDSTDPHERRQLIAEELTRVEAQIELLRGKIARLATMVGETEARRARMLVRLATIDADVKDSP